MADTIDIGGYVYPGPRFEKIETTGQEQAVSNCGQYKTVEANKGITRRDWLIGLAMKGMLSNSEFFTVETGVRIAEGDGDCDNICTVAERIADAIIAKSKQ